MSMDCAASKPRAPSSRFFGDIGYVASMESDRGSRMFQFNGKVDAFSAFEAYVAVNNGSAKKLFQLKPPTGNTVGNLPGWANRPVVRKIEL